MTRSEGLLAAQQLTLLEKQAFGGAIRRVGGKLVDDAFGAAKKLFSKGTPSGQVAANVSDEAASAAGKALPAVDDVGAAAGQAAPAAGKSNFWWGRATPEQLARGYRPFGAGTFNPFRKRMYADDPSMAHRIGRGLGAGAAFSGAYNTYMLPQHMETAGEMGAAQALSELRNKGMMDRLGWALGSEQAIAEAIAKGNPNVGQNYAYLRSLAQQNRQPSKWEQFYNSFLGQPYQQP